tara:strand:- start:1880 stop:2743 length:864 start_codon:yes stop_codon:yes gene_type:complete
MKKIIILCFLAILTAAGCSNAITYYHAERASIALEAKTTDPQQPVQGNIGIKSRTVLVAPGKKGSRPFWYKAPKTPDGKSAELGEATSVISDFKLTREKSGVFGKTDINSSFITGDAAVAAPPESSKAISGLGFGPVSNVTVNDINLLSKIYDQLTTLKTEEKSVEAGRQAALLDELGKFIPQDASTKTYYVARSSNKDLTARTTTFSKDFKGALSYIRIILTSLQSLKIMEENRAVTYEGNTISPTEYKDLMQRKSELEMEKNNFYATIGNSNIIDSAAAFVTSRL